jgi:hypothetical protein
MTIVSIVPFILLPVSMPLFLTLPPFPYRGIIFIITISTLAYLTLTSPIPSQTNVRYGLSQGWFWYVPAVARLLIPHVHSEEANPKESQFQNDPEHAY